MSEKAQTLGDQAEILSKATVFRKVGKSVSRKSSPKMIIPYWKFYLPDMIIYFAFSLLTTVTICLEGGLEDIATYIETLQENERRNNEDKLQPIFSLTVQKLNNFTLWK